LRQGKTISIYLKPEQIAKLDALRGPTSRSQAVTKSLDYLLSQSDDWIVSLISTT